MMRIEAEEIYFHPDDDDGAATAAFRAASGDYVLLQRALEPDEQDIELGMAGVYLEVNEQGLAAYDGIGAATLTPTRLVLELNEEGAARIGAPEIIVDHDLPPERSSQASMVIALIFDGHGRFANLP
jgi:hypothetical protein